MAEEESSITSEIIKRIKRLQFGPKAQLAYLEDFYTLVNDGIPANRAIEMMAQVTTGMSRDVSLSIAQKISEGQPLADGMQEWFSSNIVEIIRVGEEGGALVETVRSAINTLGQSSTSYSAIVTAVAYPLLVISMACIIIVYLNTSVFDQFREIKPIDQWPSAGQDLVTLANIIVGWWWLVILLIVVIFFVMRRIMSNYVGELRPTLDQIPPFTLYRRFVASRFLETLGLLVSNGIVFKNALKVMQYQATPYMSSHLVLMEHLLSTGKGNIADVLSTGLVSEKDLLRLKVMAEVKGFEHGLVRMGVRGSEENAKTLKLIARILGSTLLIIGAMLILMIIRGIYLTAMSMGQA